MEEWWRMRGRSAYVDGQRDGEEPQSMNNLLTKGLGMGGSQYLMIKPSKTAEGEGWFALSIGHTAVPWC